jgi:hypothetical protein
MQSPDSPLDPIEIRLAEWILYLLRGGKPEVLERILEPGAYPPDRKYDLLRSILTDGGNGFERILRDADRDLLVGANPGYALDLDPKDADDQARSAAVGSLARLAKVDFLLSKDAVLQRRGAFRDQSGRFVDLDLTIRREHFRLLVGDLLSRIAQERSDQEESADLPATGAPSPLFDERSRSLLRYLFDREPPYATQLLLRDIAILISPPQEERASDAEQDRAEKTGPGSTMRYTPFIDVDPNQSLLLIRDEWQLPERLGSYELRSLMGVGERTATFLAMDRDSVYEQQVVLRILRPGFPYDCVNLHSLHSHEAILPYQRFLRKGSFLFFVTELVRGGNLGDILRDLSGSRRLRVILRALADACEALAFAHLRGVFHDAIAPEKILFSPYTGRFRLAHFQSFVGGASVADKERRARAAQRDLHNLAAVFEALLTNSQVPWLKYILERCLNGGFVNARELLDRLNHYLHSDRPFLVVLTAHFNADAQTILYGLEIGGAQCPDMLDLSVNHRIISDLYERWDRIGELALRRAEWARDCAPVVEIDHGIQEILEEVSEVATHFVLGPKIRSRLESNQGATLWVRYDPRLAAIPWELLEIGGSRICRRFHAARSPMLLNHISHPGLQPEKKIRLLFIENPDGDLEGTTKECRKIREAIESSPFADRIQMETVNQYSDSLTIRKEMLHSDIIHFAGHGHFRETYTEDSGLSLGGTDILRASQLKDFWRNGTPFLVFANACSSGRANQQIARQRVYSDAATGLGQAFLAAGIENYIGTMWKAPDGDTTIDFAVDFYRWFLSGCTVSRAIRAARDLCALRQEKDLTWARYVLFGNPLSRIKI